MEKKFKVKGMHCKSCEMLIKDELEEMDSVNVIKISYKTGEVLVGFEPDRADENKMRSIIKNEGYEVL